MLTKKNAGKYDFKKRKLGFQLWGVNLVFAFDKVHEANIFGCAWSKRKWLTKLTEGWFSKNYKFSLLITVWMAEADLEEYLCKISPFYRRKMEDRILLLVLATGNSYEKSHTKAFVLDFIQWNNLFLILLQYFSDIMHC